MKVYTTGQVAVAIGTSQATVIRWCREGKLDSYRLPGPGGHRRIRREALAKFCAEHGVPVDLDKKPLDLGKVNPQ